MKIASIWCTLQSSKLEKMLKKWTLKKDFPRVYTLVLKYDPHNAISHNAMLFFPQKTRCAGTPCKINLVEEREMGKFVLIEDKSIRNQSLFPMSKRIFN